MNPSILSISTAVPKACFSQENIASTFNNSLNLEAQNSRKLNLIFQNSKIDKRHSVITDYKESHLKGSFFGNDFPKQIPCTEKRNQIYKDEALLLSEVACKDALSKWGESPEKITHIISVSCTGMYAPGIEFGLIEALNLNPSVERLAINFMGCFGAFKGLAIAKALAKENLKNRILLVCTELCSLHFQADQTAETFVANALFADGSAAVIVGCDPNKNETSIFEIKKSQSFALKNSQDLMSWEISNNGMLMKLSPKIPQLIGLHIEKFVKDLLDKSACFSSCTWAIHPGGKAIVEAIEKTCALTKDQTESSWETLKNYGNMSSATFLFILDDIYQKKTAREDIIGLGFGPGLSIEGILLKMSI